MNTFIALLRGINVGGHKKVPMVELRALLTASGLENVTTYIQSGNVIFQTSISDSKALEKSIKMSIFDHFGFDVPILVKTKDQLEKIFNDCPFPEDKKVNSYFTMLSENPDKELVDEASKKVYSNEEFIILKDCIYFYCANGYGNAKFNLSYFEKKLNVNATSRNYKTMVKLLSLSDI